MRFFAFDIKSNLKYYLDYDFIELIHNKNKKNDTKVFNFYIHDKLCKIMKLKFCFIDSKLSNEMVCKIVLFDDGSEGFSILDKKKLISNKYDWHIEIINENKDIFVPELIKLIDSTEEDCILFGEQEVKFGNLFEVRFEKIKLITNEYKLRLFQKNREIIIPICYN